MRHDQGVSPAAAHDGLVPLPELVQLSQDSARSDASGGARVYERRLHPCLCEIPVGAGRAGHAVGHAVKLGILDHVRAHRA